MAKTTYELFIDALNDLRKCELKVAYLYGQLTDDEKELAHDAMLSYMDKGNVSRFEKAYTMLVKKANGEIVCKYDNVKKVSVTLCGLMAGKNPIALDAFFASEYGSDITSVAVFRDKWEKWENSLNTTDTEDTNTEDTDTEDTDTEDTDTEDTNTEDTDTEDTDTEDTNTEDTDTEDTESNTDDMQVALAKWAVKWSINDTALAELMTIIG